MLKQRKKRIGLCTVLTICTMLACSGCNMAKDLSEEFEEEKVLAAAEAVIDAMHEGNYEQIEETVAEEFAEDITAEMLEESLAAKLETMGKFGGYEDTAVVGMDSDEYEGEVAVAVMNPAYENGTLTVTISYNTDYEIIGFYVK